MTTWSEDITAWQRETFGDGDSRTMLRRADDEWRELVYAHAGYALMGARHPDCEDPREREKLAEEAADVCIVLCAYTRALGVDLAAAIEAKMAKNRARKWRVTGPGVWQHE